VSVTSEFNLEKLNPILSWVFWQPILGRVSGGGGGGKFANRYVSNSKTGGSKKLKFFIQVNFHPKFLRNLIPSWWRHHTWRI